MTEQEEERIEEVEKENETKQVEEKEKKDEKKKVNVMGIVKKLNDESSVS